MKLTDDHFIALVEECIHLRDAAQRVLSSPLGGDRLTRLEGLVLLSLVEAESPQTVAQLGRNIGHARQVVHRAVLRLEELQLVEKQPNPHHRTSPLVVPTAKGRTFEKRMGEVLVGTIGSVLDAGDLDDCRRMAKRIRGLRAKVERLGDTE